jgi:hypothetical protein
MATFKRHFLTRAMPTDAPGAVSTAAAPREMRHFIARAREIAPHAPLPAYYCRLRAVEVGMTLAPRPVAAIEAVLNTLEVRAQRIARSRMPRLTLARDDNSARSGRRRSVSSKTTLSNAKASRTPCTTAPTASTARVVHMP